MFEKRLALICGLLTTTFLTVDTPAEAAVGLNTAYVCNVTYVPNPQELLGDPGHVEFSVYSSYNCQGTPKGNYWLCGQNSSPAADRCPAQTQVYSEAAMMTVYRNLMEAAPRQIRIKYYVPAGTSWQVSYVVFEW